MANHDTDAKPGAITPAEADAAMATAGEIPMSAGEVQAAVDYAVRGDGGEKLAATWMKRAAELREEAGRIHRTIKAPTDAEERCRVRADVWEEAAEAVAAVLRSNGKETACGGSLREWSSGSPSPQPSPSASSPTPPTEAAPGSDPSPATAEDEDREAAERIANHAYREASHHYTLRTVALREILAARERERRRFGVGSDKPSSIKVEGQE